MHEPARHRDPTDFAAAFRSYHAEVPPTAHDPRDENLLFSTWCARAPD